MKHLLSITDLKKREMEQLFLQTVQLKKETKSGIYSSALAGQTLVMFFEKPSLRTRLSFEIGMTQLGGHAIYLAPADIGLGKREPVRDVAIVTARMADIVIARTFSHKTILDLANNSNVPVINALSDYEHPCQTLADFLTILEIKKRLKGIRIAYLGDSENNVTHSLALACGLLGLHLITASPAGYWLNREIANKANKLANFSGGSITQTDDPYTAMRDADVVYTDTWVSMGDEKEQDVRLKTFKSYQVTSALMQLAKSDCIFMHDLPAYRGNEVTGEVIDGAQSVVWQQAENRLHVQKALILYLLSTKYKDKIKLK